MQHAVMRAPEPELGEDDVGLSCEIAIREEQQFDCTQERIGVAVVATRTATRPSGIVGRRNQTPNRRPGCAVRLFRIYVSHVDLLFGRC
jgi:hypothetical protein